MTASVAILHAGNNTFSLAMVDLAEWCVEQQFVYHNYLQSSWKCHEGTLFNFDYCSLPYSVMFIFPSRKERYLKHDVNRFFLELSSIRHKICRYISAKNHWTCGYCVFDVILEVLYREFPFASAEYACARFPGKECCPSWIRRSFDSPSYYCTSKGTGVYYDKFVNTFPDVQKASCTAPAFLRPNTTDGEISDVVKSGVTLDNSIRQGLT